MKVTALSIYPVKSLGQQSLQTATVEARGLRGDRRLMLVDKDRRFVTQRQFPKLCLIQAAWSDTTLQLSFGDEVLNIAPEQGDARLRQVMVRVWNDDVVAVDLGDEASATLSRWSGSKLRLVYMGDDSLRAVDPKYAQAGDIVSFADGFPILLIGQASLDQFNTHLQTPITMLHLRPNIVIEGAEAFAEDGWKQVRIGGIDFDIVKPCSRCVVPSIIPATGEKRSDVTRALATHRRGADGKTYFGQNLIARGRGTLNVGDVLTVLR
jgi:uncharacterized protein YcbX